MRNIQKKFLFFLLSIDIVLLFIPIARAETIGDFLKELLLPFTQTQTNESSSSTPETSVPEIFTTDKPVYTLSENIKIFNAKPGSAIEIYWLDNPETLFNSDVDSRPSNVYAVLVNDDGTANIDASTLLPGDYILVNTFETGHCSGFYLSQCRLRSDYLGEVSLIINP